MEMKKKMMEMKRKTDFGRFVIRNLDQRANVTKGYHHKLASPRRQRR